MMYLEAPEGCIYTSYLLSMETEKLLDRGPAVSLFSLVVVGSEAEEQNVDGELSFTESGDNRGRGKRN